MGYLRAFIAIEIPHQIQKSLETVISLLRREIGIAVRWVPPQNIHLTLKFLGDISHESVDSLTQILGMEAETVPSFDIQTGGLGSYPDAKHARVVWVGVQAPAELEAIYHKIDSACTRLGFESEKRNFSPHLTIGRVRQGTSPADKQKIHRTLETIKIDSLGTARVDSVHLFKSELKRGGAVYTKLSSAPLRSVMLSEAKHLNQQIGDSSPSAQSDTTTMR